MFSSFATIYLAKMYFFYSIKDDLNNYLNSSCVSLMRRVDGMWQCVQCGFSKARKNHVVGMGTYLPFTKGNVSIFDGLNLWLSLFYLFSYDVLSIFALPDYFWLNAGRDFHNSIMCLKQNKYLFY